MTGFDFLIFGFFSFHVFAGENHQCFVDIIMNFTNLDALYESCNYFLFFENINFAVDRSRQIVKKSRNFQNFKNDESSNESFASNSESGVMVVSV